MIKLILLLSLQSSATSTFDKRHKGTNELTSSFMKYLSMRTHYQGEISGLMLMATDETQRDKLIAKLLGDIKVACERKSEVDFRQGLWRATGLLIATKGKSK